MSTATEKWGIRHSIRTGPALFEFDSLQQWVNKGKSWFRNSGVTSQDTICVDAKGRICTCGRHFIAADKEGTYPIVVYLHRQDEADYLNYINFHCRNVVDSK